jgi:hypothetical protein
MKRQLVALGAALLLIAALVPPVAARSAPWTHYTWPNVGTDTFDWPGGFCGAVTAETTGVTEEYDAPRVGNTVQYSLVKHWKNVFYGPNDKTITVRVDDVATITDTYNPAWPAYTGPAWSGWPQYSKAIEAGVVWSFVASDGARLNDTGVATTTWEFGPPSEYGQMVLAEKAVSLVGHFPIYRGGFDPMIGTWTVGCQFFMDHLLP